MTAVLTEYEQRVAECAATGHVKVPWRSEPRELCTNCGVTFAAEPEPGRDNWYCEVCQRQHYGDCPVPPTGAVSPLEFVDYSGVGDYALLRRVGS